MGNVRATSQPLPTDEAQSKPWGRAPRGASLPRVGLGGSRSSGGPGVPCPPHPERPQDAGLRVVPLLLPGLPCPLEDGPKVLQSSVGAAWSTETALGSRPHTQTVPATRGGDGTAEPSRSGGRAGVTAAWELASRRLRSPPDEAPCDLLGFI